ncbi:MAG: hypothetical protein LBU18_05985 [Treponema sp.]|nr:hypothetical protein [Treponema sp.]
MKGYTLLAAPVMTVPVPEAPELEEEGEALFSIMVDELEWLAGSHPFIKFAVSAGINGGPPPALGKLKPQDQALHPDYIITGVLNMDMDGIRIFEISLWRLEDSALMSVQELAYTDIEEGAGFIPFFILNVYSTLPGVAGFSEELKAWKSKLLYIGGRAGFSPRFYTIPGAFSGGEGALRIPGFALEAGLRGEIQLFSSAAQGVFSFGLQTGLDFTYDTADFTYYDASSKTTKRGGINAASISVPLLAKFNIRPGQFVFSPYGGLCFTQPLGGYKISPPLGWAGGFNLGYKLGAAGALFLDFRFSGDIGETAIPESNLFYKRYMLIFSMGFEWGLIAKKGREP